MDKNNNSDTLLDDFNEWFTKRHSSIAPADKTGALKECIRIMCQEVFEAGYNAANTKKERRNTYRQLQESIDKMTDEQKDCNVTVFDATYDEFFPLSAIEFVDERCDVLDNNHPVLVINGMTNKG